MADLNEQDLAGFETWAKEQGLIQESHGIRSINSMCDVAKSAWQAARRQHGSAAQAVDVTSDAIARSKLILALVDEYVDKPNSVTRGTLRGALFTEFESLLAALSRRPAAAAEPSDGEIYQAVSERHATPELRAAVAEEMAEIAAAVRAEVAAEQPAAEPELLPLPEPLEIDWPQLHSVALGCGVEDRNIHDRYEAAEYGWQDGVDKAAERVPNEIYTADQMHAYARAHLRAAGQGKDSERLDAERWRAFRNRDYFDDLNFEHFLNKFREDADEIVDAAMKAGAQGGGNG